jgi:DNA-sulfur modification-associated
VGKRTRMSSVTKLEGVTRIVRPGVGPVYRGVISLADLAQFLRRATIRYSPLYQRGFKQNLVDVEDWKYHNLLPLDHPDLQIKPDRARAMAVKFLQGKLFTCSIVWNARKTEGAPEPKYDEKAGTLLLETVLTIPDTAHRHLAYFELVRWYEDPNSIPVQVTVDDVPVGEDEIRRMLVSFDPEDHCVHVDVYNLEPEKEGWLYDEFNADAKKPSTAVELDLNQRKTPARRFTYRLMAKSPIFSREEVETRRNTIGSKSRKLVTNATIEAAVRNMKRDLVTWEKDDVTYTDLLDFTAAFFEEYARGYPAWQPQASGDSRHQLRKESFALSNIIMFPLMRLVFEMWKDYNAKGVNWRKDKMWKEAIAKVTGPVVTRDAENNSMYRGSVLDRENPDWKGKVLVQTYDRDGNRQYTLSSTRQTREAAYQYLRQIAGLSGGGAGEGQPTRGRPRKAA